MKQVTIDLYEFDELPTDKARDRAVEWFASDYPEYNWWEFVYEDAKTVGIKITEFDIDRGSIRAEADGRETARLIIAGHGQDYDTYKLAEQFNTEYDKLVRKYSDGVKTDRVHEDNEDEFDTEADELEKEFNNAIAEEYLSILRKEFEYITSRESIEETIRINEYTFTVEGERY